jgi:hypothetical protein
MLMNLVLGGPRRAVDKKHDRSFFDIIRTVVL